MSYEVQALFVKDVLNTQVSLEYTKQKDFLSSDLVQVYHNNYFDSLIEALDVTYGLVKRFVGDEFFYYLAREYVLKYPLNKPDLINFGNKFHKIIKNNKSCEQYPYLKDLAKIDWGIEKVYNARYFRGFDVNTLKEINEAQYANMGVTISPDTDVIVSNYAIFDLYDFNGQDDIALDTPQSVLVKRKDNEIVVVEIERTIAMFYKKLKKRNNISKSIDGLPKNFDFDKAIEFLIQNNCIEKFNLKGNKK